MQLLQYNHADVRFHLAADEALLRSAERGEGGLGESLRFYEFAVPVVILGVGTRWREEVLDSGCRADGVPVYRRCSGGGTVVFAPGCLGYSLVLDTEARPEMAGLHESYAAIMGRIVRALRRRGLDATHEGISDLAVAGRKVGGTAQKRLRRFILHHGTLLCGMGLSVLDRYLLHPPSEPDYRAGRPHARFATNLPFGVEEGRAVLLEAFDLPPTAVPWDVTESIAPAVERLMAERYAREDWHRRR